MRFFGLWTFVVMAAFSPDVYSDLQEAGSDSLCEFTLENIESPLSSESLESLLARVPGQPHSPERVQARQDDRADPALAALILYFTPRIKALAARRVPTKSTGSSARMIEREDLESAGFLGLLHAWDSFDVARASEAPGYFMKKISGAILDELRELDHFGRITIGRLSIRRLAKALSKAASNLAVQGVSGNQERLITEAAQLVMTDRNGNEEEWTEVEIESLKEALTTVVADYMVHSRPPIRESDLPTSDNDENGSGESSPLVGLRLVSPDLDSEEVEFVEEFHQRVIDRLKWKPNGAKLAKIYISHFVHGRTQIETIKIAQVSSASMMSKIVSKEIRPILHLLATDTFGAETISKIVGRD